MRKITFSSIAAICCVGLFASSCSKSRENSRLFADRHWHRSIKNTVTCYDLATKQQQVSKDIQSSETDSVFAIRKQDNNQIEFLGQLLYLYERGDVDKYIRSGGHGPGVDYILLYDKSRNQIAATTTYSGSFTDTGKQLYCTGESRTAWTSSE